MSEVATSCELAVVGAGPAGLAAAATAAKLGIDTILLDEQPAPGGQIYRSVTRTPVADRGILGADYWRGASLVDAFRVSGAQYLPQASVWNISPELEIGIATPAGARQTLAWCAKAARILPELIEEEG